MSDELEKVTKKANDTYALLSNLMMAHEILKDKVQDLFEDVIAAVPHKDFSEYKLQIVAALDDVSKRLQILNDQKDQIFAKIRSLESDIKELKNVHREILCEQYDANMRAQELKNSIAKARNDLDDNMHQNVAAAKKFIQEKIDALFIPQDTVNMDQVKEQISAQIEPASLDARNSLWTAKNHDLRLTIVEKKVEGLLLQMKNNELNK